MESIPASLKGHFLMAMPGLRDPNFDQTVTVICEHNESGAMGIVINRLHAFITCEEIYKELKIDHDPAAASQPVHIGGPVHTGEIFLLHGPPYDWDACMMVMPTLAMSNSRDIVESVAMGRGPAAYLLCLGCAGWGPGQLETELMENAWLVHPIHEDIIFHRSVEDRWKEAVKMLGIDPVLLSSTAGNA